MDIIHCSQEEWNDSESMFLDSDTALSYIGHIQPQCFPSIGAKQALRHIYIEAVCLGYVEE
jgi:hypothetical protein